jgi:hypothetical protein
MSYNAFNLLFMGGYAVIAGGVLILGAHLESRRRRRAAPSRETSRSIADWQISTLGSGTPMSYVRRAERELAELRARLEFDNSDPGACEDCADVAILLSQIVARHDRDLQDEIDRKMAINRTRDGHGQHAEDDDSDAGAP